MMGLAWFVRSLSGVITTNVTGVTLMMIGLSLVWSSASSLAEVSSPGAGCVGSRFSWPSRRRYCRFDAGAHGFDSIDLCDPRVGRGMRRCDSDGSIYATRFGGVKPFFFTPEVLPFGFGIEPVMVLIMMPIFIVSATEVSVIYCNESFIGSSSW